MSLHTGLLQGVKTALASFINTTLGGRYYHGRTLAVEQTFPYVSVVLQPSAGVQYETDRRSNRPQLVQFHAFSNSDTEADSILEQIEQTLTVDRTHLQFTEHESVACSVTDRNIDEDPDRSNTGEPVWHGVLILEFTLIRSP